MTNCIVCGGNGSESLYAGLLRCKQCSFVYADLELTEEDFHKLYAHGYFFGEEYSNYLTDKKALQKNFRLRLNVLEKFLGPNHRRLLEIGCAYGFFLDIAKNRFESVQGIDVSEEGIRHAQAELGVNAICSNLLNYDFQDQQFDVVCLWDTIEHLDRPDLYLEHVIKHMSGGSIVAITTGDIRSLIARVKKSRWRLIHPPTHAHYFSRSTLQRFLDRLGFDVLYSRYCGFYRSIDNIAYNILVLRRKMPAFYKFLVRTRITHLNLYFNLYDILYVIAKKR